MPTSSEITEALIQRMWSEASLGVREACESTIHASNPGISPRGVSDLASDVEPGVIAGLDAYLDRCSERGVIPSFRWGLHGKSRLVGFASFGREVPESIRLRLSAAPEILRALAEELTPREFEGLCTRLLAHLDCTKFVTTAFSHDAGIDFIGYAPFVHETAQYSTNVRVRLLGSSGFIVLGQAKQFSRNRNVGVEEIREFYGSALIGTRLSEASESGSSTDRLLKSLGHKAGQPVLLIFATTASFSRDALTLCRRLGVLPLDGEQISQALAIEGVGLTPSGASIVFELSHLKEWAHGIDPVHPA